MLSSFVLVLVLVLDLAFSITRTRRTMRRNFDFRL